MRERTERSLEFPNETPSCSSGRQAWIMSDRNNSHLRETTDAIPLRGYAVPITVAFLAHWAANILAAICLGSSPATAAPGAAIASLGGVVAWAVFGRFSGLGARVSPLPFFFQCSLMACSGTRGSFAVTESALASALMIYLSGAYASVVRHKGLSRQ
jgi:hypothetical protein